jgi:hypothetical protein
MYVNYYLNYGGEPDQQEETRRWNKEGKSDSRGTQSMTQLDLKVRRHRSQLTNGSPIAVRLASKAVSNKLLVLFGRRGMHHWNRIRY